MKIAEIIASLRKDNDVSDDDIIAEAEILALIPVNMEVPALEDCAGPLSIERRNLILGRNAGLDEVRAKMEGK